VKVFQLPIVGLLSILVPMFVPSLTRAQSPGLIDRGIFDSVLKIQTSPNPDGTSEIGSAFLVSPDTSPNNHVYLITNKHMIGKWNCPGDELTNVRDWLDVYFYRLDEDPAKDFFRATRVPLKNADGRIDDKRVFAHSSRNVDIVAIDVSTEIHSRTEHIKSSVFLPSYMVLFNEIEKQLTGVGDLVFAIGYPFGISSTRTNHPIAKAEYLASLPMEEVTVPFPCQSAGSPRRVITFEGKILILDGLIVPGNSGGPVVLAGGPRFKHDPVSGQLETSTRDIKNYVIGIVSSTLGGSGLAIVYSSDYILALLDDISKTTPHLPN
jgi:Trypsin-like peptidase domain